MTTMSSSSSYQAWVAPSPPSSPQAKQYQSSLVEYTKSLLAQVIKDEEDKKAKELAAWRDRLDSGVVVIEGKRGSEDKIVVVTEVEQSRRRRAQSISKSGAKYI